MHRDEMEAMMASTTLDSVNPFALVIMEVDLD
jgi:hypothetical protein